MNTDREVVDEVKVVYRPTEGNSSTVTHQNVKNLEYSAQGRFVSIETENRGTTYNMDKVVCITRRFK